MYHIPEQITKHINYQTQKSIVTCIEKYKQEIDIYIYEKKYNNKTHIKYHIII